jgi:hypothetical protein
MTLNTVKRYSDSHKCPPLRQNIRWGWSTNFFYQCVWIVFVSNVHVKVQLVSVSRSIVAAKECYDQSNSIKVHTKNRVSRLPFFFTFYCCKTQKVLAIWVKWMLNEPSAKCRGSTTLFNLWQLFFSYKVCLALSSIVCRFPWYQAPNKLVE